VLRQGLTLFVALSLGCDSAAPDPHRGDAGLIDISVDATTDVGPGDDAGQDAALPDGASTDAGTIPPPPPNLTHWITGSAADRQATPRGGLILMGGGPEVDEAFRWWIPRIDGGDVVIVRASGSDGYNDYLYRDIGGADSVETLLVDSRALANDPYVAMTVRQAEGIFFAGGDQSRYMRNYEGSALATALADARARGAVIGGTSAGLAILGEHVFAAYEGTVTSDEALADPYRRDVSIDRSFFDSPHLADTITDSHFRDRDRMGRLLVFMARLIQDGLEAQIRGIGVDERTAMVVDEQGRATVMGRGGVYVVQARHAPAVCQAGTPLTFERVDIHRLRDGDTFDLLNPPPAAGIEARAGALVPADPY